MEYTTFRKSNFFLLYENISKIKILSYTFTNTNKKSNSYETVDIYTFSDIQTDCIICVHHAKNQLFI